jgi:hypothetical protein
MATYAQPKMDELRQQYIENIRNEVQRSTIEKVQQQIDTEAAGLIHYLHKFIRFFIILQKKQLDKPHQENQKVMQMKKLNHRIKKICKQQLIQTI